MKKLVTSCIVSVLMFSCGPQERVSKETFEEVNSAMEVKRLTEAEILEEAMVWGDSISEEAQRQLISRLKSAIEERGVVGAVEYCNVQALPILSGVSERYGVEIRRASNRYRNPQDQPTESEMAILEAYEYNSETGNKSDPNIQKFENGEVFLYTKAIVIQEGFCLSCHGSSGTEIDEETVGRLAELYPQDKAKDHKVGDLRGMWSIRIPKRVVVKRL